MSDKFDDAACSACGGSGDDPEGCGCLCKTEEDQAKCLIPLCISCNCAGCGGSCPWCGGSGKKSGWKEENPSYELIEN